MNMKKNNALAILLVLASSCASCVWAWSPQGHRTVGAIADRLLTPQAHAVVTQLLSGDLDKFGNLSGRTNLEAVSVWPDELYGTAAAQATWHYDDVPVCGSVSRVDLPIPLHAIMGAASVA